MSFNEILQQTLCGGRATLILGPDRTQGVKWLANDKKCQNGAHYNLIFRVVKLRQSKLQCVHWQAESNVSCLSMVSSFELAQIMTQFQLFLSSTKVGAENRTSYYCKLTFSQQCGHIRSLHKLCH